MRRIHSIEFKKGSNEQLLTYTEPAFPYIAFYTELDKYLGKQVPWHWHKEVELFYMEQGSLIYNTPKGTMVFPAGSGGIVNSNVLHMTKVQDIHESTIQMIHIFDDSLIGGQHGGLIEQKYVMPIVTAPQIEIIGLYPEVLAHNPILDLLRESFQLSSDEFLYEIKLRSVLTEIWCLLLQLSAPVLEAENRYEKMNDKIKLMMAYIQEHYGEKISIREIASAAYSSERECYRTFRQMLHLTPGEYLKSYRIQKACIMLSDSSQSVSYISQACGFDSSSYFGKVFREYMGCTPKEYRNKNGRIFI